MSKLAVKIGILIVAIVLALAVFEGLARLTMNEPENLAKLKSSSLFLYENKPNAVFPYKTSEFENEIRINSLGFRDDEFIQEKEGGIIRIAVLGDSQEEALQVPLEKIWQKVTGRELSEKLKKKVQVYNFGVSGYGTDQEWLTLKEKVWQFKPDLVILAFSPNDVGDTYKNNLVRLKNGQIEVSSAKERLGGNLLGKAVRETYTYHLVFKAAAGNDIFQKLIEEIRTKVLGFAKEERFFLSDAQLVEGPFEVVASQKNPPAVVSATWEVVRALVVDMKRQADRHDAQFLITVNIPRAEVDPAGWEQLRDLYHLDPATSSPYEINEVMGKIASDAGITYYDDRIDAINWRSEKGDLHFPIDAHFNPNGHLFMGIKVAEFILNNHLLEE